VRPGREGDQIGASLFADENKDPGAQRHNVEQKNGWPELQAKASKAVDNQVHREQNHPNVLGEFHDADLLDRLLG
jgi:hypothetical protein